MKALRVVLITVSALAAFLFLFAAHGAAMLGDTGAKHDYMLAFVGFTCAAILGAVLDCLAAD